MYPSAESSVFISSTNIWSPTANGKPPVAVVNPVIGAFKNKVFTLNAEVAEVTVIPFELFTGIILKFVSILLEFCKISVLITELPCKNAFAKISSLPIANIFGGVV